MGQAGIRKIILFIQLCILTAICSTIFWGHENLSGGTHVVSLTSSTSVFGTGQVRIKSVVIDGKTFSPGDIFAGDYTAEGETILLENGSTINGELPKGDSYKIIFETGPYRGNCLITVDENCYEISTYAGYWDSISHALVQKESFTTRSVLQVLVFAAVIALYYYIATRFLGYLKENLLVKCLIVISGTAATLVMASNSGSKIAMSISVLVAIPVYIALAEKVCVRTNDGRISVNYFSAILTLCVMITLVRGGYSYFSSLLSIQIRYANIIIALVYIISLPFFYAVTNALTNYILKKYRAFLKSMDAFERKFFIGSLFIYFTLIVVVYSNSSAFTNGYYLNSSGQVSQIASDIIYGYDHSWLQAAVSELTVHNYDIRHPLIKWLMIIPASAFQVIFSAISPISKQFYCGALAFLMSAFMVLTAILLKRLTKCNWIAPIYASTYFFMIMCLGYEQYQISVFLVVYTTYLSVGQRKNDAFKSGLLMSGATLTSGHMVPFLLPFNGIRAYLKTILSFCAAFLLLLSVVGSFPACLTSLDEIFHYTGGAGLNFISKIKIFTHFATWSLISPETSINHLGSDAYAFTGILPDTFSFIGICILIMCIVSFLLNKKDKVCQLSMWSVAFSFVLCGVMGWAIREAWLYSILFSWAFIALIVKLVLTVIRREETQKFVLSGMFALLLFINLQKLGEIIEFSVTYYSQIG